MRTLTLIAAFFALTITGFAQNGAIQLKDFPVLFEEYNSCCDENLVFEGTVHLVIRNGNVKKIHLDARGFEGYGDNGLGFTSSKQYQCAAITILPVCTSSPDVSRRTYIPTGSPAAEIRAL